jgi:hypothetical protein
MNDSRIFPINALLFHEGVHVEEAATALILRHYGEERFPGVSTASWIFDRALAESRSFEEHLFNHRMLPIGVGGGPFDEHPTLTEPRKEGECSATLVAKYLGVDQRPELRQLLKYVLNDDLHGSGNHYTLGASLKRWHRHDPEHPEKVMTRALEELEADLQEQLHLHTLTKEEFQRQAVINEVTGPRGDVFKVATVISDDSLMMTYALFVEPAIAVFIQQELSGNVQIFGNKTFQKRGLNLDGVALMIRELAQKTNHYHGYTSIKDLTGEGKVLGAEEWHYFPAGLMLFNGSLTAKKVPPTKIPLEYIQQSVLRGIERVST